MSVAAPSPFCGSKRLYDQGAGWEAQQQQQEYLDAASGKRSRLQTSPSGRCGPETSYAVGHSTVVALRSLFPEMSDKVGRVQAGGGANARFRPADADAVQLGAPGAASDLPSPPGSALQVIAEVLSEYGDNIDAAIKHLTGLRLSANGDAAAAAAAQRSEGPPAAEQAARLPSGAAAAAAAAEHSGSGGAAALESPAQPPRLRSAEEWVDAIVAEMGQASDVADARSRAAKVLQAFEHAVLQHSSKAGKGGAAGDPAAADLLRENALLKRAVAIQASRIAEGAPAEREVAELRAALEGARARLAALEMQNYSLQLHLKQAADSKDPPHARHNPDIF